ncbi:hypothetical protein EYF80_037784 [Liparis tanakae]|uniref:Uncharacterized protein n=1 Tax=Liparis tanakae TaxID=230148 RepID=A0A4Z2GFF5_9TELE|nr:hypothetical protein EYF80_037784 [Liparis tanakae]
MLRLRRFRLHLSCTASASRPYFSSTQRSGSPLLIGWKMMAPTTFDARTEEKTGRPEWFQLLSQVDPTLVTRPLQAKGGRQEADVNAPGTAQKRPARLLGDAACHFSRLRHPINSTVASGPAAGSLGNRDRDMLLFSEHILLLRFLSSVPVANKLLSWLCHVQEAYRQRLSERGGLV